MKIDKKNDVLITLIAFFYIVNFWICVGVLINWGSDRYNVAMSYLVMIPGIFVAIIIIYKGIKHMIENMKKDKIQITLSQPYAEVQSELI